MSPFSMPWVAGISPNGKNLFSCTGALIDKHWVLTSAQCQVNVGDSVHLHRHDMYDFAESHAEKLTVSEVVRHPKFDNSTLTSDVALVRVCADVFSLPIKVLDPCISHAHQK